MPRYFFHLQTGSDLIEDDIGLDLDLQKGEVKDIRGVVQDVLSEPQWRPTCIGQVRIPHC